MRVLDSDCVKSFIRMANDGWLQGWHERNGGNLSYRMRESEVEEGDRRDCSGAGGGIFYSDRQRKIFQKRRGAPRELHRHNPS